MDSTTNIVGAFSEETAARLTGVSRSRLRYWHDLDFFVGSFSTDEPGVPYGRLYSFRDLVALRVLYELRIEHDVPMSELRAASARLAGLQDDRWISRTLWVRDRKVIWSEPAVGRKQEISTGQYVFEAIPLRAVAASMRQRIDHDMQRSPEQVGTVSHARFVSRNRPVLAGTRITVSAIKSFADAGYSPAEILKEYPNLTPADVAAALAYENVAYGTGSAAA